MKRIKLSAAVMVLSVLSTPVLSEPDGAQPEKLSAKDEVMKTVELWRLPAVPQDIKTFQIIDTEPQSRKIAADRAVYRLGYSINEISRAHRLHIDYLPGSDNLTYKERQSIHNLVSSGNEQDRVIITGYSGEGDPANGDAELARARADKIKSFVGHANPDVVVRIDSTIYWGGNPGDGKRAEIFLIPGLDR